MLFVFGAFFVFQTGDGLSASKLLYFAGVSLATILAAAELLSANNKPWLREYRWALYGAGLLAFWLLGPGLIHAVASRGIPPQAWARDTLTHLLICFGVVIGVETARSISLRKARIFVVAVGIVASVGFTTAWLSKRGFGDPTAPSSNQLLLASIVALTLPLAFALVLALRARGINLLWFAFAAGLFLSVIVTGTRTAFVLIAVIFGICGSSERKAVPLLKLLAGGLLGVTVIGILAPLAGSLLSSEDFVNQRIESAIATLQNGFTSDQSGLIRARAYAYATSIWRDFPLLGQGVGATFPNPNPNATASYFTLDTFLTYPAKFGLIGSAVLLIALTMICSALVPRIGRRAVEYTAVLGAIGVWIAILPFGPTTEDKGFAISIALAFLLTGARRGHDKRLEVGGDEPPDCPTAHEQERTVDQRMPTITS